jgi:hypothetical protein
MLLGMVLDHRLEAHTLEAQILSTCKAASANNARIRLTVYREGQGFYLSDSYVQYYGGF